MRGLRTAHLVALCAPGAMAWACGGESFQATTSSSANSGGEGGEPASSSGDGGASTISSEDGGAPASCIGQLGCVEEFVGAYQTPGTDDGIGTAARFSQITGITGDGDDTLWVTDGNSVRKIVISTGAVSTVASFGALRGIVYVASTPPMLFVADATHVVVRRVDPSNPTNTAVFSGTLDVSGSSDGNSTTYSSLGALAWVAGSGRYFVLDGRLLRYFFNNGAATTVSIGSPVILANPAGILAEVTPGDASTYTVVVAQTDGNNLVSFQAPSAAVTPWTSAESCGGGQGLLDGPCANAQFNGVQGVAWKDPNTLLVADNLNHRIRQVTWPTAVSTVAGDGVAGHAEGILQAARLDAPTAVYFRANASGNALFIVDAAGTEIRKETLP
jgi:hypothetical protein